MVTELMTEDAPTSPGGEPRRDVLTKLMALAVGAFVGLVPLAASIGMMLDPLIKRRRSVLGTDDDGFLKVASETSLAPDQSPRMFKVVADLQDAWNKFPQTEIGSVYLRQNESGEVQCLTARCPHLGCTVDYKADQQVFSCPCHDSSFNLDGSPNNEIPPRGMDTLAAEIRDGEVWVKFQKFRAGIHEKQPV